MIHITWATPNTSFLLAAAAFLALFSAVLLAIVWMNDGKFIYSLDDAYIHLALAENLAKGHYGINWVEPSAPASSILWPFLLAPFSRLSIGQYMPLFINFIASIVCVMVFHNIVASALTDLAVRKRQQLTSIILILLIPTANLVGLALSGMEHSLQLMLSAAVVLGLMRERGTGIAHWWLTTAIVLGPLVRYENLALSLLGCVYLLVRRHYRSAFIAGSLLASVLGSFSLWLYAHGLGWLPTSVVAKSSVVAKGGTLAALGRNLIGNLQLRQGALLLVGVVLLVIALLDRQRHLADRLIAGWAVGVAVLHLAVGQFGWLSRYEVYAWTVVTLVLIHLYRKCLVSAVNTHGIGPVTAILFFAVMFFSYPYAQTLYQTPFEARNVYEIHYQLHRFITEYYQAPVATSDLGWVSYQNDNFVLDLGGLASKEALEYYFTRNDPTWMNELAKRYEVRLALIYPEWYRSLPPNWTPVARMHLRRGPFARPEHTLTFYALDPQTVAAVKPMIQQFKHTLPPELRFELVQ